MAFKIDKLKEVVLKRVQKTFLEQIRTILILGNIFGCIFFSVEDRPVHFNIILALPVQILHAGLIYYRLRNNIDERDTVTNVLETSKLLYLVILATSAIFKPVYYLIRRSKYRMLVLKMQEHNKLVGHEKKSYYRINYVLIGLMGLIINLISFALVLNRIALSEKNANGFLECGALIITTMSGYLNDVIIFLLLKEKRWQYTVVNQKFIEITHEIKSGIIKTSAKHLSELTAIYHRMGNVTSRIHVLFSPILYLDIIMHMLLIVSMLDLVFVIFRMFVCEKVIDVGLTSLCLSRILIGVVHLQFMMRNWINVTREVSCKDRF
ncbi:hypothetical protein QE152_g6695 [Popillia japonica]|uniref:Gustatory receptor n=1 Tax=Popillia japonica TaxID=7064 RepID=A0AAW1MH51_POPJA